jgi:prolyl-tRNA synthetase
LTILDPVSKFYQIGQDELLAAKLKQNEIESDLENVDTLENAQSTLSNTNQNISNQTENNKGSVLNESNNTNPQNPEMKIRRLNVSTQESEINSKPEGHSKQQSSRPRPLPNPKARGSVTILLLLFFVVCVCVCVM